MSKGPEKKVQTHIPSFLETIHEFLPLGSEDIIDLDWYFIEDH